MSRICITLQSETLDELKKLLGARSKTEAVSIAIRDQIRLRKIEGIKKFVKGELIPIGPGGGFFTLANEVLEFCLFLSLPLIAAVAVIDAQGQL